MSQESGIVETIQDEWVWVKTQQSSYKFQNVFTCSHSYLWTAESFFLKVILPSHQDHVFFPECFAGNGNIIVEGGVDVIEHKF